MHRTPLRSIVLTVLISLASLASSGGTMKSADSCVGATVVVRNVRVYDEFWIRGDGRAYRLPFFRRTDVEHPVEHPFVAPQQWTTVRVAFRELDNLSASDVQRVAFVTSPRQTRQFMFFIDRVRLAS
jgi:hypothetical protein